MPESTAPTDPTSSPDVPDIALARRLVAAQFPDWAALPVTEVSPQGHDNRSFRLNFEVTAGIWDRDVNARLADLFSQDLARSVRFDPEKRDNGFPQRLVNNTARLLSPLL